jgi:adenosine kinase
VKEQYGCVLYPTLALASLLQPPSTIHPVANVGEEDMPLLRRLLGLHRHIDLTGLRATPEGTNRIFLKYISESERLEKQTNRMKPISFEDLQPFIESDAFIFVPVTDFEVPLDTVERLRKASSGLILFDAHGPTNSIDPENNRVLQAWSDIEEWLPHIDILKMNETEAAYSAGVNLAGEEEMVEAAERWIEKGIKQVVITLGSQGALVVYSETEAVYHAHIPPVPVERVVDTTGAGDSFAAGYIYGLMKYGNPVVAAMFGNAVAGQKLGFIGPYGYKSQLETEMQVIFHYTAMLKDVQRGWKGLKRR